MVIGLTLLKSAMRQAARWSGYEITKSRDASTMDAALRRATSFESVKTVVDVGASDGRWSLMAYRHFPDAAFVLIEAQGAPHGAALKKLSQSRPRMHYVIAAAGDHEGTAHFDASDPLGGAASEQPTGTHDVMVPMTTVDTEVRRLGLRPPFLVKLDTHGFERQIFEGARTTLAGTTLLIVEAYNFQLQEGSFRFHELCTYLDGLGFRPVDLVDVLRRPSDGVLWQFDLVFARSGRPEFSVNSYSAA